MTQDSSAIGLRLKGLFYALFFIAWASGLAACGGSSAPFSPPVAVSPATASLPFGWTQQFSATIAGVSSSSAIWSVNGVAGGSPSFGMIDGMGLYTAPAIPPIPAMVSITATNKADAHSVGSANVNLEGLFVYVTNQDDGTLSGYSIDSSGLLVPLAIPITTTGAKPFFLESTPDGKFLYVTDLNAAALDEYNVNPVTGELTQIEAPTLLVAAAAQLGIHPSGKYLYAPTPDGPGIYGFSIDESTGKLTAIPGSPFPNAGSRGISVTFDRAGEFAFVANNFSKDISVFSVNSANGQLTSVGPRVATGNAPAWIVSDTSGHIYTMNDLDNTISEFSVGSGGALSPLSPPAVGGVTNPLFSAVSPSGKFLYVPNWTASSVSVFSIDASGNLSAIAGSPFASEPEPASIGLEPSGMFVYTPNQGRQMISGFSVDKNSGALTRLPWTITAGAAPTSVAVVGTHP